jgi:hypothetical protein
MARNSRKSPAPDVAKERKEEEELIVTLIGGIRAKVLPVPASLIDEVASRIEEPKVPVWHNEEKGRDEPNPSDPAYIKELAEVERQKGLAAIDALAMFGLELIDPIQTLDEEGNEATWLKKLRFMGTKGLFDLDEYDLDNPMELEYLWKRYIGVDTNVLSRISRTSGITQEEVTEAEKSFQRNKERTPD